ncbi:MAG TPA: hypothetical protein VK041_10835 [Opitutales bacterium]|nr:hypothetical protein [Opitutales bacterium]
MNGSHNSRFWSDFGETGGDYFLTIEGRDDENVLRFEKKHYKSEYHHFSTAMVGGPERLEWFIDNQLWRQTYLIDFLPEEAQRKIRTFTESSDSEGGTVIQHFKVCRATAGFPTTSSFT